LSRPHLALPSFPTRRSSDLLDRGSTPREARRPDAVVPAHACPVGCVGVVPGDTQVSERNRENLPATATLGDDEVATQSLQLEEIDRKSTRLNSSHDQISYAV